MGVATSDPDYLPAAPGPRAAGCGDRHACRAERDATGNVTGVGRPQGAGRQARRGQHLGGVTGAGGATDGQPNYSRYLSTPKKGKAIFTSRQNRQRRRVKILLGLLVLAAVALALFWYFFLR